jgi:hypothetical protein
LIKVIERPAAFKNKGRKLPGRVSEMVFMQPPSVALRIY